MYSIRYLLAIVFLLALGSSDYHLRSQTSPGFLDNCELGANTTPACSGGGSQTSSLNGAFQRKQDFPIPNSAVVKSWNSRTGVVAPQNGDYSFNNITGSVSPSQLPLPTTSTIGGVQANTIPSGQFVTGIDPANGQLTSGVPAGGGTVTGTGTSGDCAIWTGSTPSSSLGSTTCGGGGGGTNLGVINIKDYGATGDGACHQLSGAYGSLSAAQAVYPFVSDLTQCIDWAAIQQAINVSYTTAPLTNGSFPVYCPVGEYQLSNPLIADTPVNGTGGSYAAWSGGTTYGSGAQVTYNGLPFISAGSGNIGNPPTLYGNYPANLNILGAGGLTVGYPWATVAISNGSPAVITPNLNTGGTSFIAVTANQPVVFFTQQFANPNGGSTPALPTGINANQIYYVIGSSITGTTFEVSATPGGAAINTSSAGVGNFFVSGQVWQFDPVQTGSNFNVRISLVGADGLPSNSGCNLQTQNNLTAPAVVIGPGNGNLVKNISVQGNIAAGLGSPGANGYRCTTSPGLGGPAVVTGAGQLMSIGWAVMSNGGGAHTTRFENVGAANFYVNDYRSYGNTGELVDSNSWFGANYFGACINILMASTQSYINEIYSSNINEATTNLYASDQEGVVVHGGNLSTFDGLTNTFAITGTAFVSSCANFFACVTATVTSPDNNLQAPMCAYSAGQANNRSAQWLNSWPFASGCGYNTFVIPTAQWGLVGMYIANYNPITKAIVLGIPKAFAGIYQGACCGSNLGTEIAAATTLYATEAVTMSYGNSQIDSVHVENDGVPTTLSCFCTEFFGGSRPAQLKNLFIDSQATGYASVVCCNQNASATNVSRFYGQQVIPYINSTVGDTIVEALNGGSSLSCGGGNCNVMDRVSIATISGTYFEMRHTAGFTNGQGAPPTGSAGNPANPAFDFMMSSIQGSFTPGAPLLNPTTFGQLSGGYYAMGGSAFGGGLWDNGSMLGPFSQYSLGANSQQIDVANTWRTRGWGQTPQWGVRPAQWSNPCITPQQYGTLAGSLPAITYVANLQDYLVPTAGGSGYVVGNQITLAGGTFTTAGVVQVDSVSGGAVTAVHLVNNGAYTNSNSVTTFMQGSTTGSGTGAQFSATGPIWFVNYNIPYPMMWGGKVYTACNYTGAGGTGTGAGNSLFTGGKYAAISPILGYSYGQNLTTTNVPHLSWTMDGASPFIYMNYEALELMFPGLVFSLTGSGSCSGTEGFIVLEVHPTAGYVKVVRADNDGSNYVPALAASGTTCSGTAIGQQAPGLVTPY